MNKKDDLLIERFRSLKVGQHCVFPSPLEHFFTQPVQAFLVSEQKGEYWEFSLLWMGVCIGSSVAEIRGDSLVLEII